MLSVDAAIYITCGGSSSALHGGATVHTTLLLHIPRQVTEWRWKHVLQRL
jgi:hypothetical protein